MATKVQIIGGKFQTPDGTKLSQGKISLTLSQDANIPSTGLLGSGITFDAGLDQQGDILGTNTFLIGTVAVTSNICTVTCASDLTALVGVGNRIVFPASMTASFLSSQTVTVLTVATGAITFAFTNANYGPTAETSKNATIGVAVTVWANDTLLPTTTYYTVFSYSSLGQQAWGPFYGQVLSSPSPYNVGAWIPPGIAASSVLSGITLQTNGVNNTSQSLLNIKQGTGMTVTGDGAGGVTISSSLPNVTVQGQGGFMGGLVYPFTGAAAATSPINANNQVRGLFFVLPFAITIGRVTVIPSGSSTADFGIFNTSGTKLWSTGAVSYSGAAATTTASTPATLQPGVYAFCWTAALAAASFLGPAGTNWLNWLARASSTAYFTAANAATAGTLPATLGALSVTASPTLSIPGAWFEA